MLDGVMIGLDMGTTSTKAVVFGEQGKVLSSHSVGYPLYQPQPGWAEQDPEEIFQAVLQAIQLAVRKAGVGKEQILGVGVSTAMHSLIVMDEQDQPLTRTIIWTDNRSAKESRELKNGQGLSFYQRTGTPIHPMSPLCKIAWLKANNPECFRRAAKFISIKEYVLHKLFGRYMVDYSIASATGLFHLEQQTWDQEILQWLGINEGQLSELVPATHSLVGIHSEYAEVMGLLPTTPWVIGASDGVLANLGVGAISPGEVAVTIGTSGAVRSLIHHPMTHPEGHTFCYELVNNQWIIGGATNNGAILLRWFERAFMKKSEILGEFDQNHLQEMLHAAEQVPPGAEGLICLPYLAGERAPVWNEHVQGVFMGVGLHHQQGHFVRALMEGVMFNVHTITQSLQTLSGPIHEIRASGGFVQSSLWRQMLADITQTPVAVPEVYEASALGAAVLALYALQKIEHLTQVKDWIKMPHRHEPNLAVVSIYQELYSIYAKMYPKLMHEMGQLATFRSAHHS